MRRYIRFALCLFALCLCAFSLAAQSITFPDVSTLTAKTLLQSLVEPTLGIIIVASGYLSALIPGLKKWEPFYRVLAFAVAAGFGFYTFGTSFATIAITYFLSSGLYVVFLRNILPSPAAAK